MYRPRHFAEDDVDALVAITRRAGFAHLVVNGAGGLTSSPLPVLVDDGLTLVTGHVARANTIWTLAPCPALVIVPAGDAYISPSWYPTKVETQRVVPTWNYEVVHLHGTFVAHDDPAWCERLVRSLTERHEATMPDPWSVDDAPAGYVDGLLRAIVGIELIVERVEGKRKLSQNRPEIDREGVVEGLRGVGNGAAADAVADAIERPVR